jgi:hypothetical protein
MTSKVTLTSLPPNKKTTFNAIERSLVKIQYDICHLRQIENTSFRTKVPIRKFFHKIYAFPTKKITKAHFK